MNCLTGIIPAAFVDNLIILASEKKKRVERHGGRDSAGQRKKVDNLIKARDRALFPATLFLFLTPLLVAGRGPGLEKGWS